MNGLRLFATLGKA